MSGKGKPAAAEGGGGSAAAARSVAVAGAKGTAADVESYFAQLRNLLKQYRRIIDKITAIKGDKKKGAEIADLCMERKVMKDAYLSKKKTAKNLIALLTNGLDVLKERELRQIVEEFRELDGEFKSLGVMLERDTLMEGAAERRGEGKFDPTRAKNDELIGKAEEIQRDNLSKLKGALMTVEGTKETAKYTAAQLEQDREKIKRIEGGLDEVQSELELSRQLITRFMKRVYTDKVVIAFTALLVLGLAGIITYAVLNPNQSIFNVPDAVKPNYIPGVSPSASPSPPHVRRLRQLAAGGADKPNLAPAFAAVPELAPADLPLAPPSLTMKAASSALPLGKAASASASVSIAQPSNKGASDAAALPLTFPLAAPSLHLPADAAAAGEGEGGEPLAPVWEVFSVLPPQETARADGAAAVTGVDTGTAGAGGAAAGSAATSAARESVGAGVSRGALPRLRSWVKAALAWRLHGAAAVDAPAGSAPAHGSSSTSASRAEGQQAGVPADADGVSGGVPTRMRPGALLELLRAAFVGNGSPGPSQQASAIAGGVAALLPLPPATVASSSSTAGAPPALADDAAVPVPMGQYWVDGEEGSKGATSPSAPVDTAAPKAAPPRGEGKLRAHKA